MLDLHPDLIVITFFTFIFLIFGLNRLLYRPLLSFIRKREEMMNDDYRMAKKNSENANSYGEKSAENLKEARLKAEEIIKDSISKAQEEQNMIISKERESLESEYESFLSNLGKEQLSYKNNLLKTIPNLEQKVKSKLANLA